MKNSQLVKLAFLLLFTASAVQAEIRLPALIGDNMVLQRESEVPLWGTAAANARVTVTTSWNDRGYTVRADRNGNWRITVSTPQAGGPYEMTFTEDQVKRSPATVQVRNVLIGEVWLCSGQSNMEMPVRGFKNQPVLLSNELLADAGKPMVRLFQVQRAVSATEAADCTGSWELSSPGSVAGFSAVGYQFARRLQEILQVPVGIIQSTWGGTPIEAWTDRASLSGFPELAYPFPSDSVEAGRLVATCLYNGMIAPLAGYGIKGFLWYQGEANRARPEQYTDLMEAMVRGWRKKWGNDQLPFYYVQIAPYDYPSHAATVPYLREAQLKAMERIPCSGMVVSVDVGSSETIHPPDKSTIARRLLYWALANEYHMEGIAFRSPEFESLEVKGNKLLIRFKHALRGLSSFGKQLTSFEVAGADRVFHPAVATLSSDGVLLHSDQVAHPVAARYAFKDDANGNLYNTAGLPASPFRTDDWELK